MVSLLIGSGRRTWWFSYEPLAYEDVAEYGPMISGVNLPIASVVYSTTLRRDEGLQPTALE
jgi:hypothetical protein